MASPLEGQDAAERQKVIAMWLKDAIRQAMRGFALLASAMTVALAGCGASSDSSTSSSPSASSPSGAPSRTAQELFADSNQAIKNASSVTIRGAGRQSGGAKIKLDLQLSRDGGKGAIDLLGMRFRVVRVAEDFYIKGSPLLYRRLGLTGVPPGAWVKTSASNSLGAYTNLAAQASGIVSTTHTITKGAVSTIAGEPVIELRTAGRLYRGRLYVKATGQPYPVKLEKKGRETATFTFSDWNATPAPTAPAAATSVER
jgi:hypothetical protein